MLRKNTTATEVSAMRKLDRDINSAWVDWAVQMLVDGQDTPSLRVLAGETGPFNQFEMTSLVDRTLDELGVDLPSSKEDALLILACGLIRRLADDARNYREMLLELKDLFNEGEVNPSIDAFYQLYWACEYLDDDYEQHYWVGATSQNMRSVVVQEAKRWLEELEQVGSRVVASEDQSETSKSLDPSSGDALISGQVSTPSRSPGGTTESIDSFQTSPADMTKAQPKRKWKWMKAIAALLLLGIGGCTLLAKYTLGVRVGGEYEFLFEGYDDFAWVTDFGSRGGFYYRIESVDGAPSMRADHSGLVAWVPAALLEGGEHLLSIRKCKSVGFDPPEKVFYRLTVNVKAGESYELVGQDGALVLEERHGAQGASE